MFKVIFLTIANLARQAWLFPQTLAMANRQKRQRIAQEDEFEAERLDRLRNPSKYLERRRD
jgi:hypothetical protein